MVSLSTITKAKTMRNKVTGWSLTRSALTRITRLSPEKVAEYENTQNRYEVNWKESGAVKESGFLLRTKAEAEGFRDALLRDDAIELEWIDSHSLLE